MSLEAKIEELIEALNANTAALNASEAPAATKDKAPPKKKAAKKKAEPKTEEPAEEVDEEVDEAEAAGTEGDDLDYDIDVKPKVLEAAKMKSCGDDGDTGRDVVVAVLSRFGVKKATELNADRYADFLDALAKGIDGGVAAV